MSRPLIDITRKQALIYAGFLVLYEFLTYIANDMIMPGMIKVVESFHGQESAVATSLTAYVLGGASLQLILGPVSDRYGRRPVMIFGAILFFLCTTFIIFSNSIHQFLLARFFEGMGLCFICVVGYATLQEMFNEMDAIRLISIMSNISILAPLIGPLVGATFIHYFSWRLIFVAIAILSLLALWGLWSYMPETIHRNSLAEKTPIEPTWSFRIVIQNYVKILSNTPVVFGSIAMALLGIPCLAWIALSPVILVTDAKLTLIQYGLWQIPVFSACILGNLILRRLTHAFSIKAIIILGAIISILSLVSMYILPLFLGNHFIWLMPGLIIYFFGYGLVAAPLNRFILFATTVTKGTTSAVVSMTVMCIGAEGIELMNDLYAGHNNRTFGLYCAVVGVIYALFQFCSLIEKKPNLESEPCLVANESG